MGPFTGVVESAFFSLVDEAVMAITVDMMEITRLHTARHRHEG